MGVFKRPDSKYWQIYLEPLQQREPTDILIGETITQRKDSRTRADQRYHERMIECATRQHHVGDAPIPERFDRYAARYARDVISAHRGDEREQRVLARLVAFFGSDLLALIDRDRVRAYMTARRAMTFHGRPISANTINREVDLLKAMLRDAVPKYLTQSPLLRMKKLPIIKVRKRLLGADEEARLLAVAAADPQDYALLVLGIDTLVRLGDLLDLRRQDRQGLWIDIRQPKSGEAYQAPLTPRAAAALNALTHADPYYFPKFRRAQNPRDWRGAVRQRLEALCARTTPPIPFGQIAGGITFHGATRKTGATRFLIERQLPLAVVQAIGNWKRPDVLLNVYTDVTPADLLRAVGQPVEAPAPPPIHVSFTSKAKVVKFKP